MPQMNLIISMQLKHPLPCYARSNPKMPKLSMYPFLHPQDEAAATLLAEAAFSLSLATTLSYIDLSLICEIGEGQKLRTKHLQIRQTSDGDVSINVSASLRGRRRANSGF